MYDYPNRSFPVGTHNLTARYFYAWTDVPIVAWFNSSNAISIYKSLNMSDLESKPYIIASEDQNGMTNPFDLNGSTLLVGKSYSIRASDEFYSKNPWKSPIERVTFYWNGVLINSQPTPPYSFGTGSTQQFYFRSFPQTSIPIVNVSFSLIDVADDDSYERFLIHDCLSLLIYVIP